MGYSLLTMYAFVIYFIYPTWAGYGIGSCKKKHYEATNEYDFSKLKGVWYEYKSKSKRLNSLHNYCPTIKIYEKPSHKYRIVRRHLDKNTMTEYKFVGTPGRNWDPKRANYKYSVIFKKKNNEYLSNDISIKYKIIDTDYNCWAIVYTCLKGTLMHTDDITVLLKSLNSECSNSATFFHIDNILKEKVNNMRLFSFYNIAQEQCSPHYSEIDA